MQQLATQTTTTHVTVEKLLFWGMMFMLELCLIPSGSFFNNRNKNHIIEITIVENP